MTLQVFRDGRPDREANRISNPLLAKLQKEDDQAQVLKQFLERDAGDGTYGYMGSGSGGFTAPKAMLGGITRAERVARVRARMANGEPVKSLYYDTTHEIDLLAVEDAEAFEEGWICPECIQYQAMPANECNWRFVGERPADPKYWGCGYRRDLF